MNTINLFQFKNVLNIVAVLAVFASIVLIGLPQSRKIDGLNSEISSTNATLQDLQANLEALNRLQTLAKEKPDDYTRLTVAIPQSATLDELFVALDGISVRSGAKIASLTPVKEDTQAVEVDVTVNSSYEQLVEFMSLLSRNLRPIDVQTFAIASSQEGGTTLTTTLKLKALLAGQVKQENEPLLKEGGL